MNSSNSAKVSKNRNNQASQPHVVNGQMDVYHFRASIQIINTMTEISRELNRVAHELENLQANGFNANEAYTLLTDKRLYERSILAWGSIRKIGHLISQKNPNNFNTYFETHRNKRED